MEKIEFFDISNTRNDEHYQFMDDFNSAVQEITPAELAVVEIYPEFQTTFVQEDKSTKQNRY